MAYIGNTPEVQRFTSGTDYFSGDGSTTEFTLSRTVNSVNDIEVTINNVQQNPVNAYNVNGNVLTISAAPTSGTDNVYVRYFSNQVTNDYTAAAKKDMFYENSSVLSQSYSITPGKNAMSAGPVDLGTGVTVDIPTGSVWTIV